MAPNNQRTHHYRCATNRRRDASIWVLFSKISLKISRLKSLKIHGRQLGRALVEERWVKRANLANYLATIPSQQTLTRLKWLSIAKHGTDRLFSLIIIYSTRPKNVALQIANRSRIKNLRLLINLELESSL